MTVITTNRRLACKAFYSAYVDSQRKASEALLKLRMSMIEYPDIGNVEPPKAEVCDEWRRLARQSFAQLERHSAACAHCKAARDSYHRREAWTRGRGAVVGALRCALRDYKRARANYWRACK